MPTEVLAMSPRVVLVTQVNTEPRFLFFIFISHKKYLMEISHFYCIYCIKMCHQINLSANKIYFLHQLIINIKHFMSL